VTDGAFPWEDAMGFCLGVLRWSPDAFWRATPREVAAACAGLAPGAAAPLRGGELAGLMRAFPDARESA